MIPNNIYQHHQKYQVFSTELKEYAPSSHKSFTKLAKLIYVSYFFFFLFSLLINPRAFSTVILFLTTFLTKKETPSILLDTQTFALR